MKNVQSEIVAVAMSGGVDSAVAAALLKEQGYAIIGVTAKMTAEYSRCCADEDIAMAQRMAAGLGVEHHVVDVVAPFRGGVIEYFTDSYLAGRTPSPCVECNRLIKFGALLEHARKFGATKLATGHYARISADAAGWKHLFRGIDGGKDQSYFLAMLDQEQLSAAMFPLGAMKKPDVVAWAAARGLESVHRGESQEICFVTGEDHGSWIDLRSMKTRGRGDIVDAGGRKLGEHQGLHYYTIGQRKGLGIATGSPVFITAIDAVNNRIVVGSREEACRKGMLVKGVKWMAGKRRTGTFRCLVQVRYKHEAVASEVSMTDDYTVRVVFDEPQFAVTPGQLAAFYEGDELIGGGWIEEGLA